MRDEDVRWEAGRVRAEAGRAIENTLSAIRWSTVLGLTLLLAAPSLARDPSTLRDLTIPVSRVPDWRSLDDLPLDTTGWTRIDVPCNGGDGSALQTRFDAAPPNSVLMLPPNCRFVIGGPLHLRRSNVVLRGASRSTSILEFTSLSQDMLVMTYQVWPPVEPFGNPRSWTAGFTTGTTVLTVANTSGLAVGGWVRLAAQVEPDWHPEARNRWAAKLVCVGATGGPDCAGLSANQVRLDRGLPAPFTQGGQTLSPRSGPYAEHIGIENVRIQHSNPSRVEAYRAFIQMNDCFECWVTDSSFGDGGNMHMGVNDGVTRSVIRGNDLGSNQCTMNGTTCSWNKGAIYFNQGSADNLFENNSLSQTPSGPDLQGGAGNVVAYNFMTSNSTVQCERHVFLHGQGNTATLVEGNDVDCMMQWDSYRNGQGYNNTFYRNRLRGIGSSAYPRGRIGSEDTAPYIHRFITVLGNHVNEMMGGPQPTGRAIDESGGPSNRHEDTWVTHNVVRSNMLFETSGAQLRTTQSENFVRNDPSPGWASFDFPPSLYRTEAPAWWCEESGPFPNIGAPSDRVGGYSKLPAQIRLEGGTCTTPTNTSGPLPVPIILD